jgi:serine protease DegS
LGLAAALLVLVLRPDLLPLPRPVVEVRQAAPLPPAASPGVQPASYATAVARAAPSVVNVYTTKVITQRAHPLPRDPFWRRFFGEGTDRSRRRTETSLGSGVLVSPQGYLLTNHHVIEDAEEIYVALRDGRGARARVVGHDPETDLAVLRVDLQDLPSITFGHSDALQVGDVVLAIGNPFGVGQTVTMGIVSATGRSKLGINSIEDFIQTDAAINPGNSGGALINARGELVGVNTAIYSQSGGSQGIGFAIPEGMARGVMEQIIENGAVIRGWLGVEMQDITPELARSFGLAAGRGVLVAGVLPDSPAQQAGLEPGDVILAIGGQPVADGVALMSEVTALSPGNRVDLRLLRERRERSLSVLLGRRPVR